MKKWLLIVLSSILLATLIFAIFTQGFQKGMFSGRLYTPDNVYEEIWNLFVMEEHTRNKTVLTSSTEDASEDWDFGFHFKGVHIPQCNLLITWSTYQDEIGFSLWYDETDVHFIYDYKTKTLYGDTEFSYLMDHFLTHYFEWCAEDSDFSSEYSADSLGDFTFKYVNPIYIRNINAS